VEYFDWLVCIPGGVLVLTIKELEVMLFAYCGRLSSSIVCDVSTGWVMVGFLRGVKGVL